LKHTYKPGSAEYIRFKEALRVARKLENIPSHKKQPLDIAKDIMRMDKETAGRVIDYLNKNPRDVIGGSAASYTQIEGARQPRDIDILVQKLIGGTEKKVALAKQQLSPLRTKSGEHVIDIHGKEMYAPGKYHRFGFSSKSPIKIGGRRFFRAGEQLFRKAVSAVSKETQYRHFKDVPDFIVHAKSLIKSGKMHWWSRGRALSAEKSLDLFLHPEKSPEFGKSETFFGRFVRSVTKKPAVEFVETIYGPEYLYQSYVKPSYYIPPVSGSYFFEQKYSLNKQKVWSYKPSFLSIDKYSYGSFSPSQTKSYISVSPKEDFVPYIPEKVRYNPVPPPPKIYLPLPETYTSNSNYKPSKFKFTLSYTPPPPPKTPTDSFEVKRKKKRSIDLSVVDVSYRYRKWNVLRMEDIFPREVRKAIGGR